jgi:hypothetical protein
MMRGGCQAVASAISASGRRYWAMEIGGSSSARVRHAGVIRVRGTRRGGGRADEFGQDMTIDPYR